MYTLHMHIYIYICIHIYILYISEVGGFSPTGKSFLFVRVCAQLYVRSEWISNMITLLRPCPFRPGRDSFPFPFPPSPQSSYPALVGVIGIYIYIYIFGCGCTCGLQADGLCMSRRPESWIAGSNAEGAWRGLHHQESIEIYNTKQQMYGKNLTENGK